MPLFSPLYGALRARFEKNDGTPLSGGLVNFYITGTSTRKDTYTDSTGATPNANPVVLDSRGEAAIFLKDDADYKVVVTDAAAVTIYTEDPVKSLARTLNEYAGLAIFTASGSFVVPDNVTELFITSLGGGAGGGSGAARAITGSLEHAGGGEGGSAGELRKQRLTVTPGSTLTVAIGAGGIGGVAVAGNNNGNVGAAGGDTTITGGLTAKGGAVGASAATNSTGTAFGGVAGRTNKVSGGVKAGPAGASDGDATSHAVQGGSGGGVTNVSTDGAGGGGAGAPSEFGLGGVGGNGSITGSAVAGAASTGLGTGGGGGGGSVSGTSGAGAAGKPGIVIIQW